VYLAYESHPKLILPMCDFWKFPRVIFFLRKAKEMSIFIVTCYLLNIVKLGKHRLEANTQALYYADERK
jgi:hypothetical protein